MKRTTTILEFIRKLTFDAVERFRRRQVVAFCKRLRADVDGNVHTIQRSLARLTTLKERTIAVVSKIEPQLEHMPPEKQAKCRAMILSMKAAREFQDTSLAAFNVALDASVPYQAAVSAVAGGDVSKLDLVDLHSGLFCEVVKDLERTVDRVTKQYLSVHVEGDSEWRTLVSEFLDEAANADPAGEAASDSMACLKARDMRFIAMASWLERPSDREAKRGDITERITGLREQGASERTILRDLVSTLSESAVAAVGRMLLLGLKWAATIVCAEIVKGMFKRLMGES